MGVLSLWPLLEAARETCDLQSLSGLTLAVDLSGWICEACALRATMGKVNKPHLRTLFFRVALLYRLDVKLVFVCDGSAVELKYDTIAKRINARNGRTGGQAAVKPKKKCNRSQLNRKVKECVDLLTCLGIPTIKANGEAEALCALLNAAGAVDGCITEDSDTFLYGATVVYRGISTSSREMEVSRYAMSRIREKIGFDRRQLVSLAVLLGCDYLPHGIPGVGKETVLKLLQCVPGDILHRFDFWTQCRGQSSEITHAVEIRVCRKALDVSGFPFPEVISEYLSPGEALPKKAFNWVRPQLKAACNLLALLLDWPQQYAYDKVFPLLSNWHLKVNVSLPHLLLAHVVLKACVRSGMPCYEVVWRGSEAQRPPNADDVPRVPSAGSEPEWMVSIERRDLVERCHPRVAQQFIAQQECLKKAKKAGTRKKAEKKACQSGDDAADKENEPIDHGQAAKPVQPSRRPVKPVQAPQAPAPTLEPVQPAPAAVSLRDRLKRPACSETRTLDACVASSSEAACEDSFVYVAPSNPFKLHDESMEAMRARGFELALANLDASMANVSLHEIAAAGDDSRFASPAEVPLRRRFAPTTAGDSSNVSSAMSVRAQDSPPTSSVERALWTELAARPSGTVRSAADPSPSGDVGECRVENDEKVVEYQRLPLAERLRQRRAKARTGDSGSTAEEARPVGVAADSLWDDIGDPTTAAYVEETQHVPQDLLSVESLELFDGRHESYFRHESSCAMERRPLERAASVSPPKATATWTASRDDSFVMSTSTPQLQRSAARPRAMSADSPAGLAGPLHSELPAHGQHEQWMRDVSMNMSFSFSLASPGQPCAMEESFGLTRDAHLLASLASSTPAKSVHLRQQEHSSRGVLLSASTPGMSPCFPQPRSLLQMDTASPMSDSMMVDVGLLATLADGTPGPAVRTVPGPAASAMWGRSDPGQSTRTMWGGSIPFPSTSTMWGSSSKPIVID